MKYICQICGYVYDDAKEKVPFEELPDDWKCPLCGAAKSDFKPEANGDEKKVVTAIEPMEEDLEKLSAGQLRATADANADRGAARVCVWGEKVTRMLSSLVNRYLNEGEAMLKDTNIWVCTTCGFVYIGDTPPELCPVCKVPDWKFEKIEGRA